MTMRDFFGVTGAVSLLVGIVAPLGTPTLRMFVFGAILVTYGYVCLSHAGGP